MIRCMSETVIIMAVAWLAVGVAFTVYRVAPYDRHWLWEVPLSPFVQPVFLLVWCVYKQPRGWFWWVRREATNG